jgi:nicotinamide-nucleotide amidase
MSVVSYSAKAKRSVLGVGAAVLRKHGTVSEETSLAMAEGIRRLARTDVGLSVTGVAGPERVEDKDVGIVFVAAAVRNAVESKGLKLTGDRETIKKKAALEALRFLKQVMKIWL